MCVATEAAGEGINLQFCHLMINYDMPWNPNRLEQRMGRIHRIGQNYDVYVFNFVAQNTIEGGLMQRLLDKLDEIRAALGDRVFDVIGLLLQLNDVRLEEMLREAAYNPAKLEDYEDQIERLSAERLQEFEQATGIAMATSHVDLSQVREHDYRSEERRLMPEYVESFFVQAAEGTRLHVEPRADGLWRVDHVPERFRSPQLRAYRRSGPPRREGYAKLTFLKQHLREDRHLDAELMSPGHSLFAATTELLEQQLAPARQAHAAFVDPATPAPYALRFFETRLVSERPGQHGHPAEAVDTYARLVAVLETPDGTLELAPPDVLHDLTPREGTDELPSEIAALAAGDRQRIERWVRTRVQFPLVQEQREQELRIRAEYLERSFDAAIGAAQNRWSHLAARVASGEEQAKFARDEALRRVEEMEQRKAAKLAELAHLRVVRQGPNAYLGSAVVLPVEEAEIARLMRRDEEVERIAMEQAVAHEQERGWEPTDVSRLRDGSGFDIRSLSPAHSETGQREVRRIEVKGRSCEDDVVLTPNEWLQARRHGETYWLYVVWNCGTEPRLLTVRNPARALLGEVSELTVVKGYRVGAEALSQRELRGERAQ